ncbi:hypothetical protein CERSUDRAFT_114301 [Gelatoporia subvermispora B]|uniref:Histone chaperone domain-containing protein n=1 Tax=Ceriporiopsis subvermispora (strain B) TaxID=914234 RepID=M2PMM5_CERS8|nr:hypothetical protein CERSUDRAFT_114301 [Gelatoporia subvermispora B]
MSTDATAPSNTSSDATAPTAPAHADAKGKGKGKAVEDTSMEEEEEEEEEEDDDEDDDEEEEEEEEEDMEEDDLGAVDPSAIISGGRRTRGVRVDYTSQEAIARAGLTGHEDDDEDESMRQD